MRVRCVMSAVLAMVGTGCMARDCGRTVDDQTASSAALASLKIRDLCETNCPGLLVDSLVRVTRTDLQLPDSRQPVIRRLLAADLKSVESQVDTLVLGGFADREADSKRAKLMLYQVQSDTLAASQRLFAVAFHSPGAGVRGWHVLLECSGKRWRPIDVRIFFQP